MRCLMTALVVGVASGLFPTAARRFLSPRRPTGCSGVTVDATDDTPSSADAGARCKYGTRAYWDAMYRGTGELPAGEYSWYCAWPEIEPFWQALSLSLTLALPFSLLLSFSLLTITPAVTVAAREIRGNFERRRFGRSLPRPLLLMLLLRVGARCDARRELVPDRDAFVLVPGVGNDPAVGVVLLSLLSPTPPWFSLTKRWSIERRTVALRVTAVEIRAEIDDRPARAGDFGCKIYDRRAIRS